MTAHDLQLVREATDVGELIGNVVRLRRMPGNTAVGLCPFHNEKTGSLRVNLKGHRFAGLWRCHGCNAHGDVYDFVQAIDSCDLPTAVRRLAHDAGINLSDRPETPQERRQRDRDKLERDIASWYFREQWKQARRSLDRAMRAWETGNPFADDAAGIYGARLRWIERERKSDDGLAEFRRAHITERQYRVWLCGDLRRFAARLEFVGLILRCGRNKCSVLPAYPDSTVTC